MLNRFILLICCTILYSCNTDRVIQEVPDVFVGTWYETSDDVVNGYAVKQIMEIGKKSVSIYADGNEVAKVLSFKKIKRNSNGKSLEIECKEGQLHSILYLSIIDGILAANEWVPSGISDSDGEHGKQFPIGRFYKK